VTAPTIGQVVHYRLTDEDETNVRFIGAHGNRPRGGDVYPAMIVRVWNETNVNLQVFIDGPSTLWATSRVQGDTPGRWMLPPPRKG